MKRFLLPVLGWTLAISQLFAQPQTGSTHFYVAELSQGSQRLLELTGLHQSKEAANPMIESRASELRLDSTAVYHNYTATDSMPKYLTWYMYPQENATVNIDFQYDTDHWITINRTTTLRDEMDRIVDVIAQRWDETLQTYLPESRLEVFPHLDSPALVDSFIVSVWKEGESWSPEFSVRNTYDNADRLLESRSDFVFFDEILTLIDRYTYVDGLLNKIQTFTIMAGEEVLGGEELFLYQNDTLFAAISYTAAGIGEMIPETRMEYSYYPNGQVSLINHFIYDFEKQDWKFWRADGYAYDDEDRLALYELVTIDDAGILSRNLTSYTYTGENYMLLETNAVYDNSIESWIVTDKKFYYYSELVAVDPELPADVNELIMYPNPTFGMVQMKIESPMKVFVYTMNGQLVKSASLEAGEKTVDLTTLPAGLYQLRATSLDEYYSGKLVKQ